MITLRPSSARGHADHGWLRTFHSFSFADYDDPAHRGFGNLRVLNEDRIAPGSGFGTHGHRDMEIVSVVVSGALAHRDSIAGSHGTGVIRPGEVQRMSAGRGVLHSEFNAVPDAETHFLQIWLLPSVRGIAPSYEQRRFDPAEKRGRLRLIACPEGSDGALTVHADAAIYAALVDGDEAVEKPLAPGRLGYVHVVRGDVRVNGHDLHAGDAAKLADEPRVVVDRGRDAEVLVFDLAP